MYTKPNLNNLLTEKLFKLNEASGKRVLVRTCLNVSTDDEGKIKDDTRLIEALPLIQSLIGNCKKIIITGHLGRPENKEKKFSFWNIAERMEAELRKLTDKSVKVKLVETLEEVEGIEASEIENEFTVILIENIRFFPDEESKDPDKRMPFANELATLADIFINDAFPDYRESASTYDIVKLLPSFLGPSFANEINNLTKLSNPERPFIAVLGGAKLSEKLDALNSLLPIADKVIIGGAMAYTLLQAKGISTGKSLVESDKLQVAREMIEKYFDKLVLPVDHIIADEFRDGDISWFKATSDVEIPEGKIALDIGPKTIELFKGVISNAKSILMNGPIGVFEWELTSKGTKSILESIIANTNAYKLAGGGDSITAVNKFNIKGFNHISTGGGAMLAILSYDKFPTLDVILDA